ncbi:unnamed protein product [Dicrocoelium dendriticum]|nr:unnamed protein product [Dicrocoelium dendriticum]
MAKTLRILDGVKSWELFSSLCIKRPTVITPQLTTLESKVADLFAAMDFEKSHLSSHELRDKIERSRLMKALERGDATSVSNDGALLTARELELEWQEAARVFKPADRLTEFDESGNAKTAWRQLDKPLVMLVKQSFKNEPPAWCLPCLRVENNRTLRETADVVIEKYIPKTAKCRIFGNAPSAVHVYKYRDKNSGEKMGAQYPKITRPQQRKLFYCDTMFTVPWVLFLSTCTNRLWDPIVHQGSLSHQVVGGV